MKRFTADYWAAILLVSLGVSFLLPLAVRELLSDAVVSVRRSQAAFARDLAAQLKTQVDGSSTVDLSRELDELTRHRGDIESITVRGAGGSLLAASGEGSEQWSAPDSVPDVPNEYIVPITGHGDPWGQVEVRFRAAKGGLFGLPFRTDLMVMLLVGVVLSFFVSVGLQRLLQFLNPARVIPPRVREALDALAEGLLVLDTHQRIVLVNRAFETTSGRGRAELIGAHVGVTEFRLVESEGPGLKPWDAALRHGDPVRGVLMSLERDDVRLTFSVSSVPISDDRGRCRGLVIGFEDVTALERKQEELRNALTSLRQSSEEIRKQNRELEWLATRDALTGCVNRRSFFHRFEEEWEHADRCISAVMIDMDHFKSINDNYGHATGDDVLRQAAATIIATLPEHHVVCRYGGEEFAVLMPGLSLDDAEICAEHVRLAVESLRFGELRVSASLGVSSRGPDTPTPEDLLSLADKSLYAAKRHGRNRVVRSDSIIVTDDIPAESARHARRLRSPGNDGDEHTAIPFQAVTALVSAMSYRDFSTAAHSRRVADLCVAAAEGLLSMRECYALEIAALLHDIGKIGVPDQILHKVGPLTDEEWELMRRHRVLGVQLVRASFAAPLLTEIMAQHSTWYDLSNVSGTATRPGIAARILAIADAFDAMTSDAPFRRRMSRTQAFDELRRCAGTQFDPELVERFISSVRLHAGQNPSLDGVTTDSALNIGLQIERLVAALDDQDLPTLRELTVRILAAADRSGIDSMVGTASLLQAALDDGTDMIEVMQIATELLDLCRLTQGALINNGSGKSPSPASPAPA